MKKASAQRRVPIPKTEGKPHKGPVRKDEDRDQHRDWQPPSLLTALDRQLLLSVRTCGAPAHIRRACRSLMACQPQPECIPNKTRDKPRKGVGTRASREGGRETANPT